MTRVSSAKRIIGSVVNGQYKKTIDSEAINNREHPLHREYVRGRMREDYARDIVQPYVAGQVNTDFIEAYGKNDNYAVELAKEGGLLNE